MRGIFGLVRRNGAPLDRTMLAAMRAALPGVSGPGAQEWLVDGAALARDGTAATPESREERLPTYDPEADMGFTAVARLDNRAELLTALGLARDGSVSDGLLLLAAYREWGEGAPTRVLGDWAFAAWHPRDRKLFLARDHFGHGGLYYYSDSEVLAFARSRRALDAAGLAAPELDELYLAQHLVAWPLYYGGRTIAGPVRRLPPAHSLTLTPERLEVRPYWRIEDVSELRLRDRAEYVARARELFEDAVRVRLHTAEGVGATLSGGLDSGSVAVIAGRALAHCGGRLRTFTAVPLADPSDYVGDRIGDELPLARITAAAADSDLEAVEASGLSPVEAIRQALDIYGAPMHAAGNMYWIMDLLRRVRDAGCSVLLTGQEGNGGISWTGDPRSQPLAFQLRELGALEVATTHLRRALPRRALVARARRRLDSAWLRSTAIHPDFARRLDLREMRSRDAVASGQSPLSQRLRFLVTGRSFGHAVWSELGANAGVEVRDPTADPRVVAFALSVPDRIFIDPVSGTDRWLMREAMRGRLPDEVRLNRRRGRQGGDIVPRLRACAGEVDAALEELSAGPATAYLDVPYMEEVWRMVQREDSIDAFRKATTVLMRGLMAGLYVNGIQRPPAAACTTA